MSRTIRRPCRHLIQWWLPKGEIAYPQRNPWHQVRYPGRLVHDEEPQIVRTLQSDLHRFFSGVGKYNKHCKNKQVRQQVRLNIHRVVRSDELDSFQPPFVIRRYQ